MTSGRVTSCVVIAAALSALLAVAEPALGQDTTTAAGPVTPGRADTIRAALERPPPKPPLGALDIIALPVRILVLPLRIIGYATAELVGTAVALSPDPKFLDALAAWGVQVGFGTIGPRSGVAAQARFFRYSPLFLEAGYSIRTSQRYRAGLSFARGPNLFETAYTFQRNAEPYFWGVGPDTEEENQSDYLLDQQTVSVFGSTFRSVVRIDAEAAYEDNRVGRGKDSKTTNLQDRPGASNLFGVDERTRYVRFNLGATLDLTRNRGFQRVGVLFQGGAALFRGIDGTDSDFHRFDFTLRGYVPLNPRQQFAFQVISELMRGESGGGVPFFHLASLGDSRGARSLDQDRFRDRDMAALMTEWRYEIWRELHERSRVESFLFFDTGAVENRLTELDGSDFVQSFGFGMRIIARTDAFFVTYIAFGDEGPRGRFTFATAY